MQRKSVLSQCPAPAPSTPEDPNLPPSPCPGKSARLKPVDSPRAIGSIRRIPVLDDTKHRIVRAWAYGRKRPRQVSLLFRDPPGVLSVDVIDDIIREEFLMLRKAAA